MTDLADLTWPDAGSHPVLAVPLGSTEQHGPHLPLSTDTDIAVALAEGLAARVPEVVVAPAVAYGSAGEHAGFEGTLSIGQEAFELLVVEMVRSAPFERVVLVNAHGGNAEPLAQAVALLRDEGRAVTGWSPPWRGDAHAGRVETSVMLALCPERVRLDRAEPGRTEPISELLPALRAGGVRAASPNGVLGDPAGASAQEGRTLLATAIDDLASEVRTTVAGCSP